MVNLTHRRLQWVLWFGIALIGCLLFQFVWGPWSPASRARSHTLAATQELYHMLPFTIVDQVSEERVGQNGCWTNQNTLRIGSSVPLTESISLFTSAVQKIGWTRQPDDYAGLIYYFKRAPGEVLALYTENIGPREWLQKSNTDNYSALLYVVVASGTSYTGFCNHF